MEKLQRIQTKRKEYERKRRKRYLYLKNIGRLNIYYAKRLAEIKRKRQEYFEILKKSKIKWWKKIILNIQKFFYNLKSKLS